MVTVFGERTTAKPPDEKRAVWRNPYRNARPSHRSPGEGPIFAIGCVWVSQSLRTLTHCCACFVTPRCSAVTRCRVTLPGMAKRQRSAGTRRRAGERPRTGRKVIAPLLEGGFVPPCVICGHGGRGERTQVPLSHGVAVWLCPTHSGEAFLRRRGGTEFAQRLLAAWAAAGAATARRVAALKTHVQQIADGAVGGKLPGSYSWPKLREEAERRFAADEDPATVIAELRGAFGGGPAVVPSVRTMRRWFTDGRWRSARPRRPARVERPVPKVRPPRPRLRDDPTFRVMYCAAFPWISYRDP